MWDRDQVERELDAEAERYLAATPTSYAHLRRSARALPLGVASSFQSHYPYPFVIERGAGAWVWDLDGGRYLDVHGGFGVNLVGHAHPEVVAAVTEAAGRGMHFAAPHEALAEYVLEIGRRFSLEQLRLTPSGTEATMDALRFARAHTGRDLVVKMEGSYHGHHDVALVSTKPDPDQASWPPRPVTASEGILPAVVDAIRVVSLNDEAMVEALFNTEGERVAAIIIEPILCNLGFTRATESYLKCLRQLCDEWGSVLIWDEVKTGAAVAYAGVQSLSSVRPDLVCLGKAVGGGAPIGVVGGRAAVMDVVARDRAPHYGTFSGNPLAIAAGTAALRLLDHDAYRRFDETRERLTNPIRADIERYDLPLHVEGHGAKGGVFCSPSPPSDYRAWRRDTDTLLAQWGWLRMLNGGVWGAPGADEQWTLSTEFDDECVEQYLLAWETWRNRMIELRG